MPRFDVDVSQFDYFDEKNLREILSFIKDRKNPIVAELGCWAGKSTSIIADFLNSINCGQIYTVDTFAGCDNTFLGPLASSNDIKGIWESNMKELGIIDMIKLFHMTTDEASTKVENGIFDLVFIDADHRYESVRKDILNWLPKTKENAIMCGHDFNSFQFEEKYIHEDCINGIHHGVTKAVLENFKEVHQIGSLWYAKVSDAIIRLS